MNQSNEPLTGTTVRADGEKIKKAIEHGINLSEVFRLALDKALLNVDDKCPTCGRKVK